MKHTVKYTNEPLGKLEVIDDFLPPPERLILKDDGVKVTIALSKRSVEFFKEQASRSKVTYQKMIRALRCIRQKSAPSRSSGVTWKP